jgi:3-oxoacyl-[acyl-carrier-protein] synthase III
MPSSSGIRIIGTGSFVPQHVASTEFIGSLVARHVPDKGASWAIDKLGVRERRFAVPLDPITGHPNGETDELNIAARAAEAAMVDAAIGPGDLAGLWYVSCTQSGTDRHFSRMALRLHARLGLRAEAFALCYPAWKIDPS